MIVTKKPPLTLRDTVEEAYYLDRKKDHRDRRFQCPIMRGVANNPDPGTREQVEACDQRTGFVRAFGEKLRCLDTVKECPVISLVQLFRPG